MAGCRIIGRFFRNNPANFRNNPEHKISRPTPKGEPTARSDASTRIGFYPE